MTANRENVLNISMVRADLEAIPNHALPAGYTVRRYRPGDERAWVEIERQADAYNVITPEVFSREFGGDVEALKLRQCYLCEAGGSAVGTATAWYDDDRGRAWGRLHWVAIVPRLHGRGLSKPLLTVVCERLRALGHDRACLSTETARIPAICLYLKFGFLPEIRGEQDVRAWLQVRRDLPEGMREKISLPGS